jgi:hypothetical protein
MAGNRKDKKAAAPEKGAPLGMEASSGHVGSIDRGGWSINRRSWSIGRDGLMQRPARLAYQTDISFFLLSSRLAAESANRRPTPLEDDPQHKKRPPHQWSGLMKYQYG